MLPTPDKTPHRPAQSLNCVGPRDKLHDTNSQNGVVFSDTFVLPRVLSAFGHVTINFRNQREESNSNRSRDYSAHESRSTSGWTPFPFFAPGATSGTWRQLAVVLGKKADTTPPRKGPRDLSKNVFVMSTRKLKRNSLPT